MLNNRAIHLNVRIVHGHSKLLYLFSAFEDAGLIHIVPNAVDIICALEFCEEAFPLTLCVYIEEIDPYTFTGPTFTFESLLCRGIANEHVLVIS